MNGAMHSIVGTAGAAFSDKLQITAHSESKNKQRVRCTWEIEPILSSQSLKYSMFLPQHENCNNSYFT